MKISKKKLPTMTRRGQILAGTVGVVLLGVIAWWYLLLPNPLIGKWVAIDKDTDPFRVSVTLIGQLEFLPDAVIQAGESHPASYSVSRDSVVVAVKPSFGEGMIQERYTIRRTLSGLVIQRPVPFMPDGMVEYRRIDGPSSGQRPS